MIHPFSTFAFGLLFSAVVIAPIAIRSLRRREVREAKALSLLALQRGSSLDISRRYIIQHTAVTGGGCYTVQSTLRDDNVVPIVIYDFRYASSEDRDFARISAEELCETLNDLQRWTN